MARGGKAGWMTMLSMTGYGRYRVSSEGRDLLLELKSVNHRFLDVNFRLPKALTFLEDPLRELLNGGMRRGHVELTIIYQNNRTDANAILIDRELLMQCAQETQTLAKALDTPSPTIAELIAMSGALSVSQADENIQAVTALAEEAYGVAFKQLQAMRVREGEALAADLTGNLEQVETLAKRIAALAPMVPQTYRERLEARLKEWNLQGADPQRVAQEIALAADRCAIDEELARLQSHFLQFRVCLNAEDEVGRRMDFLLQEMNREVNTIGSKASDAEIAHCVVEMKCLLEKLREQVQNVL